MEVTVADRLLLRLALGQVCPLLHRLGLKQGAFTRGWEGLGSCGICGFLNSSALIEFGRGLAIWPFFPEMAGEVLRIGFLDSLELRACENQPPKHCDLLLDTSQLRLLAGQSLRCLFQILF